MPVLVFEYDGRRGWLLRNVGNGPALNIVVARKHMQRPIDGEWFDLVRIPPLSRDGEMLLDWLQHDNEHGLGAAYDDFTQRTSGGSSYTTTCGDDLSEITVGRLFGTGGSEIRPHWRS